MSEEKLYMVKKNHSDEFWDFLDSWALRPYCPTTPSNEKAEQVADNHGGHVVTFVEEPEKVVLTKEQAEIVEGARDATYPASYISNYTNSHDCEENLLINAYVNGYTVAEDKYRVLLPESWCRSEDKQKYFLFDTHIGISWTEDRNDPKTVFTKEQLGTLGLDRSYFKKDEVTDGDQ